MDEQEIEKLAVLLFEHCIEQGQQAALEDGLDKVGMMPYKSKWQEMGADAQDYWRDEARFILKAGYRQPVQEGLRVLVDVEPGSYRKAKGVLPWTPNSELPEDTLGRLRSA